MFVLYSFGCAQGWYVGEKTAVGSDGLASFHGRWSFEWRREPYDKIIPENYHLENDGFQITKEDYERL